MELTGKQKAYLKGIGNGLDDIVKVGSNGITKSVIKSLDEALTARELVKVSVNSHERDYRKKAVEELVLQTGAKLVSIKGKAALIFRENPENRQISDKL
ncbi:MAG TPA: ribosome assembly RNA-binding protein YhbY [Candidatus Cloacimonas sp.]|jgi:RNA-binding protein|nr:RNA-binding protein [Candidatus Cloacimonadota bacterium]HCX72716.1 ribosome assembly RNA-binding protein YhbY [Candidatus Cloacimonas sp.]